MHRTQIHPRIVCVTPNPEHRRTFLVDGEKIVEFAYNPVTCCYILWVRGEKPRNFYVQARVAKEAKRIVDRISGQMSVEQFYHPGCYLCSKPTQGQYCEKHR